LIATARIAVLGDDTLRESIVTLGFEPCDANADALVVDLRDAAAVRRAAAIVGVPRIFVGGDSERPLVAALGLEASFVVGTEPARIGPALMQVLPARSRAATRLVVVTSARGGVGRTLLATNLVRRLVQHRRVWLVDATGSGAAAWWLAADPRPWPSLESLVDEMSIDHLRLSAHETEGGVRVVGGAGAAPTRPLLDAVVRVALASEDVVIVDAPTAFDALTSAASALAQRTLFLSYDDPISHAALPPESDDVWLIASQCARPQLGARSAFRAMPRDDGAIAAALAAASLASATLVWVLASNFGEPAAVAQSASAPLLAALLEVLTSLAAFLRARFLDPAYLMGLVVVAAAGGSGFALLYRQAAPAGLRVRA
jgi:hypothetical protein